MSNLADIIRDIVGKTPERVLFATVTSVDAVSKTCEVVTIADEMTIFDVRLVSNDGDGVLIIPTESTPEMPNVVGICMINEVEGFVALHGQIDSIQFGDGSFDGLIKIADLVTKLNNLENIVTSLVTNFNAHVHITTATIGAGPTPGVISATTSTESGSITNTVKADIENPNITHGDF